MDLHPEFLPLSFSCRARGRTGVVLWIRSVSIRWVIGKLSVILRLKQLKQ